MNDEIITIWRIGHFELVRVIPDPYYNYVSGPQANSYYLVDLNDGPCWYFVGLGM